MKKIFLAALTALALCSYSYAQDDDEYEEDSPRAAASESSSYSSSAKKSSGEGFIGLSIDALGLLNDAGDLHRFGMVFKLTPSLELSARFGLAVYSDSDGENAAGNKVDNDDGGARIALGAGVDYFLPIGKLPFSVGGEFLFTHWGEDDNSLDLTPMVGARAEIIKNFCITGKVGFNLDFHWWTTENGNDLSQTTLDIATRVDLIWFFI